MPYRELFPVCRTDAYFNNAGVAPTSTRVREAVAAWIDDLAACGVRNENDWEERAEALRANLSQLVGAHAREIAFVRNTSHGLGLVAEGLTWQPGDEVAVCLDEEYPSNVYPWQHLATRGVVVTNVPARDGGLTTEALAAVWTPRTRLVAVSAVQYASGHRTDLAAVGRLCRERGAWLCVDGIQQVGAFPLDVHAAGVDFLAADSHKWMLGLPGIGFLFVSERAGAALRPSLVGWKSTVEAWNFDRFHFELRSDAAKLEEGTPAYPMLAGLAAAVGLLREAGPERIERHIAASVDAIARTAAALGYEVGPAPQARAGIVTIAPRRPDRLAALAADCEARRVRVSVRRNRLRVSPHIYNDDADLAALTDILRAHAG